MYKNLKFQISCSIKMVPRYFTALLLTLVFSSVYSQSTGGAKEYRVFADDFLTINVFGERDLSFDRIRVSSAGYISMPLVGEINVSGLKLKEIEEEIERRLADGYLKDPQVTIFIREYRPIFIYGEINKPGAYPFENNITVEKVIALAGGLSMRASTDKIELLRKSINSSETRSSVQMQELVRPGDVIKIGKSFF